MSTKRMILINTVIFIVIAAIAIGGYAYYSEAANYVKTDDAKITGDLMPVTTDTAGKITDWQGTVGKTFKKGDVIGKVALPTGTKDITAPIDGTIVQNKTNNEQLVAPGQPIAQMVDRNKLYVLANIEETSLEDVNIDQDVDIQVDATSNSKIKGKVKEIGQTTNSVFSLLPADQSSGTYTKVVQRIPVKIELDSYPEEIVPGMNATIWIHK
ncbi:HlyD family secretion protein [Seinonella peptonophila]|uniref:HlyD family secretion protein n=1 Tax=Seinonella peptonophila TaxID=112248 RepID=A0A1M4Z7M3_9BACL|nr:HlyD family efflux transporter periplasmic adaptor subunit [Seinonella peptonophila]SHF13586.1 HlyD family secretion protein [Seinonella peptonophila]